MDLPQVEVGRELCHFLLSHQIRRVLRLCLTEFLPVGRLFVPHLRQMLLNERKQRCLVFNSIVDLTLCHLPDFLEKRPLKHDTLSELFVQSIHSITEKQRTWQLIGDNLLPKASYDRKLVDRTF